MKITKADKWFSYFIRLRDAFESNGVLVNKCFTCGKFKSAKELQCGHFVKRQHKGTRYSEINCECQCGGCNKFLQGNDVEFAKNLELKHGKGTVEKLKAQSRQPTKVNEALLADYYKDLVTNLIKEKGWEGYTWF